MSHLSDEDSSKVAEVVTIVMDAVAPVILKCVTAVPARDYRKEVWLLGFQIDQKWHDRDHFADETLKAFDKRFPK